MGSLEDEIRKLQDAASRAAADHDAQQAAEEATEKAQTAREVAEFAALMRKHHIAPVPLFVENLEIEFRSGGKWRPDIYHYWYSYVADMWVCEPHGGRYSSDQCLAVRCDGGKPGSPRPYEIPPAKRGYHKRHPPGVSGYQGLRQIERYKENRVVLEGLAKSYASQHDNRLWVSPAHLLEGSYKPPWSITIVDAITREARAKRFAEVAMRFLAQGRSTDANFKLHR
ncbi:hypothetical protein [Nocardia sp. NPDC019255]|uniref:hypothetical protein n=1 Tax=Nocardia sp. NPDC019255 TaxID=3154591 RepID=UPI0033FA2818